MVFNRSCESLNPIVSVIVPCYNCESSVTLTLESLERQKFKQFELILINDGSTDGTDRVLSNYIKQSLLDIVYINQKNGGVSVARNNGIDVARGRYIVFLDADDIFHEDFISVLFTNISESGRDVAYCILTRNPDAHWRKELQYETIKKDVLEIMAQFMYRRAPLSFFTFIYSRSIVVSNEIRFPVGIKYGEDQEFLWKYLTHVKSGVFINAPLYGYLDNPTSVMRNINWSRTDAIKASENVGKYLLSNGSPFADEFKRYMTARNILQILKHYASAERHDLFNRLEGEYDTVKLVKELVSSGKSLQVKISALIYITCPKMFYHGIVFLAKPRKMLRRENYGN